MTVPSTPDVVEVAVPALREVPIVAPVKRRGRALAYSLGGAGLAALATSRCSARSPARNGTPPSRTATAGCATRPGSSSPAAHTYGNLSTGLFVVGAGALAAGAILVLSERRARSERAPARATSLHIVPRVGPTHVGLTVLGGL